MANAEFGSKFLSIQSLKLALTLSFPLDVFVVDPDRFVHGHISRFCIVNILFWYLIVMDLRMSLSSYLNCKE